MLNNVRRWLYDKRSSTTRSTTAVQHAGSVNDSNDASPAQSTTPTLDQGQQQSLNFSEPHHVNNLHNTSTYYEYTVQSQEGLPSMAQHHHLDDVSVQSDSEQHSSSNNPLPTHGSGNNNTFSPPLERAVLNLTRGGGVGILDVRAKPPGSSFGDDYHDDHQYITSLESNNNLLQQPFTSHSPKSDEEISVALYSSSLRKTIDNEYYSSPQRDKVSVPPLARPIDSPTLPSKLNDSFNSAISSSTTVKSSSNTTYSPQRKRTGSNVSNNSSSITHTLRISQQLGPFTVYSLPKNQTGLSLSNAASHHRNNRHLHHGEYSYCEECPNCNIAKYNANPFSEISIITDTLAVTALDDKSSTNNNITKLILMYDRNVNLDTSYSCCLPYYVNFWNYEQYCDHHFTEKPLKKKPPHHYFFLNEEYMFYRCRSTKYHSSVVYPISSPAAACLQDGRIFIWDLTNSRKIACLQHHKLTINCIVPIFSQGTALNHPQIDDTNLYLQYTPFAQYILTGSEDKSIKLWDISSIWSFGGSQPLVLSPVRSMLAHETSVTNIELFSDGTPRFCSCSIDGKLFIWNWFTGELLQNIQRPDSGPIFKLLTISLPYDGELEPNEYSKTSIVTTTQTASDILVYNHTRYGGIEDLNDNDTKIISTSLETVLSSYSLRTSSIASSNTVDAIPQQDTETRSPHSIYILSTLKLFNVFTSSPATTEPSPSLGSTEKNPPSPSMGKASSSEFDIIVSTINNVGQIDLWKSYMDQNGEIRFNKITTLTRAHDLYGQTKKAYQKCSQLSVNNHFLVVSLDSNLFIFDISEVMLSFTDEHLSSTQQKDCKLVLEQIDAHSCNITSMISLHFGKVIVTGAEDGSIALWDTTKYLNNNIVSSTASNVSTSETSASNSIIESIFIGPKAQSHVFHHVAKIQIHTQEIVSLLALNENAFVSVAKDEPFIVLWKDSKMEKRLRTYMAFHYDIESSNMPPHPNYHTPNMLSLMVNDSGFTPFTLQHVTPSLWKMPIQRPRGNSFRRVQSAIGLSRERTRSNASGSSNPEEIQPTNTTLHSVVAEHATPRDEIISINTKVEHSTVKAYTLGDERTDQFQISNENQKDDVQNELFDTLSEAVSSPTGTVVSFSPHSRTGTTSSDGSNYGDTSILISDDQKTKDVETNV
ncbi:hypothetical protein C9374_008031 [Naegleria lovaniensis]|uniref:Guanine nucleotide-binding protein subunit beta-like protein n=1 Tax=Naegleria lovaniensis TaxID=51637 RepID=A0AA88KIH0_NAELO|nr:uncharacterized protein C9374_008031 [Naegleria lovaniensis]KAG2378883.1 hypothetical protein C9374_008031 [Naegleria lovaniensis]